MAQHPAKVAPTQADKAPSESQLAAPNAGFPLRGPYQETRLKGAVILRSPAYNDSTFDRQGATEPAFKGQTIGLLRTNLDAQDLQRQNWLQEFHSMDARNLSGAQVRA